VSAFEPEPSNVKIFNDNISLNGFQENIEIQGVAVTAFGGDQMLFLSKGRNKYRHTLVRSIRGREAIMVKSIPFSDVLALGVNAIKMDIEGAELEIFDNNTNWEKVTKLTFEYHFDFDRLIANFYDRIEKLGRHFTDIYYGKMPDKKTYDYYPAAKTVYCTISNAELT
jgi:FkbM family methyltransferase